MIQSNDSMLSCPNFNRKKVSYFGFLYYLSFDEFSRLVKLSNGIYINSYLDNTIDYIILNEDVYYKFIKRQFKKYEELYYIYLNSIRFNTLVISEMQMLKLCKCDISKLRKTSITYLGNNTFLPQDKYIVMSMLTTGWDYYYDQPYQISALKIDNDSIADIFLFNIQSMGIYNNVLNSMYYIPKNFSGSTKVMEEIVLKYNDFIENLPIISCNTYLKNRFISCQYYNITTKYFENPYIDILELANNLPLNSNYCNFSSIMKSLNLSLLSNQSSLLTWCMSMQKCYETLKSMTNKKSLKNFKYNPFLNRSFVLEGIFKKFSRKSITNIIQSLGGKVGTKISNNTNFLVLSNDYYYNYLNDNKSEKDIQAQRLIKKGSNLQIISENVMCNIVHNYEFENNTKILF